ncbi:MAG: hypothetical protein AUJ72_06205 [Candidatus Omnitrophica bacterium CG1_02_46_14]|nr:MAG: hypothetical protein AUJ72_06205 [Candidatus Omnitrophica bacterium CG1_02_46_14]
MGKILKSSLYIIVLVFLVWAFFFAREATMHTFNVLRMGAMDLFSASSTTDRIQILTLQVKDLEMELSRVTASSTVEGRYHYKIAAVYSEYPYNDGGTIIIDVGSVDGITAGMPVMASEGVLLGKVTSVRRTQSEVETIFSPRWKSSVGVGNERIKAVVEGGIVPTLNLISKEAELGSGENVINLSSDYPLYAFLGTAGNARAVPNDVWQKAELTAPYRFENLISVLVVTDFH